ncbi:hypothetical protein OF83DRAFT_1068421 [Amylostereum chailletii]|nr:hypothetical protein OF83DRAFT_1068421 [Amylostereum chailletii]
MTTSLAAQLAQGASFNSSLLVERTRRKPTESYLFTGREADQHDLESLYALASNAFIQLKQVNPGLASFEDAFFSDAAKGVDRTMLAGEATKGLDARLKDFLPLLGKHLMEGPTGRVLEWLVRRFRINEFNVDDVLALFLPYHDSPHFAKMVTILHIKPSSTWSFLNAYKSAAQSLPRSTLVVEMQRNTDVMRFVASLLPTAIRENYTHRTLLAFHTGVVLDYVARAKLIDDGISAALLPTMIEPLETNESKQGSVGLSRDIVLSSYLLLSAFSQKCHLSSKATKTILAALVSCAEQVTTKQFVTAALSVLGPQDRLNSLPREVIAKMLDLPEITETLVEAFAWIGSDNLIIPMIPRLLKQNDEKRSLDMLTTFVTAQTAPLSIRQHITSALLNRALSKDDAPSSPIRRLLSAIHQRDIGILEEATRKVIEEDPTLQEKVDQIVLSFPVVTREGENAEVDMVVASMSASEATRLHGVQELIGKLVRAQSKNGELKAEEKESVTSALLARLRDPSLTVIKAFYGSPTAIIPVILEPQNLSSFLSTLSNALPSSSTKDVKRIRAHLRFLIRELTLAAGEEVTKRVFQEVMFPFLIFSKPTAVTTSVLWEELESGEKAAQGGIVQYELLRGCAEAVQWESSRANKQGTSFTSPAAMIKANLAAASRMAETILVSNDHDAHFAFLLNQLAGNNRDARNMAYLIARSLLGRMSGERQMDAAQKIFDAMDIKSLEGMDEFMRGSDSLQEFLSDARLGQQLLEAPHRKITLQWLQISILALIPIIARPAGGSVTLLDPVQVSQVFLRSARYVRLMRDVYKLTNSTASLPFLSIAFLRALFMNLADDALTFLAGIWVADAGLSSEDAVLPRYRRAALSHAVAFLKAHEFTDHVIDFQTVVPALLVALQDGDTTIRKLAGECIQVLAKLSKAKSANGVYAFDAIYGKATSNLQYLDWVDYQKYVEQLAEGKDHFAKDPSYLGPYHQQILARKSSDPKKIATYKQRVICFILSHANTCALPVVKLSLLRMLENVSDAAKARTLATSLQSLSDEAKVQAWTAIFGPRFEEFVTLHLAVFDGTSVPDLNDPSSGLWAALLGALRFYFRDGASPSPRQKLVQVLEREVAPRLSLERQLELCQLLLEFGSQSPDVQATSRAILVKTLHNVPLIVRLLTLFQPTPVDIALRANKRAKVDQAEFTASSDSLVALGFLAEVLGGMPLHGSTELIACLLDTLNKVVHSNSALHADKVYLEQLLMVAVENSASEVSGSLSSSPAAIRLDVLVDIIRMSDNPQTFHQALLLIASLARLAPDSVLQNIMPVFTFMGSNVFHRDDTYSFPDLSQTVDSIVPVMVSSMKEKYQEHLELLVGSRDFVRIFTDAANHIPRHRRTQFFVHLVDVLGPEEFLPLVCLLFVGKTANRIVRQSGDDLHATLSLPLSLIYHYPISVQLPILVDMLHEAQRLVAHAATPDAGLRIILDASHDDEQTSQLLSLSRRRAQAIVVLVGAAFRRPNPSSADSVPSAETIDELLSILLELSQTPMQEAPENEVEGIRKAARVAIAQCLGAIPAVKFVESVATILSVSETSVHAGALELFAERLPMVSEGARKQTSQFVVRILDALKQMLSDGVDELVGAALVALKAIGSTLSTGEENAVFELLSMVVSELRNRKHSGEAVAALVPVCTKLGPRVLPFFPTIVKECVDVLREGSASRQGTEVVDNALEVLKALFNAIPSFWSDSELTMVFRLFLDCRSSASVGNSLGTFVRAISKKATSKVLFPALFDVWSTLEKTPFAEQTEQLASYFELTRRVLRTATRPSTLENIRPIFKIVLQGLDLRGEVLSEDVPQVEQAVIGAFLELVTKLNETAFRPLFRKLFDWAFADPSPSRKITFLHMYCSLLDQFKSLMTSYLSILLQPLLDILQSFSGEDAPDEELWASSMSTLTKSFDVDEGAFWRDDKLEQTLTPVINQVPVCAAINTAEAKAALADCLAALCDTLSDDASLKRLNLDLLMHTRSEEARVRILALQCSTALWHAHGMKLVGFVSETATFIAECAEDEHDSVVRATHTLKKAVEEASGEGIDA